MLIHIVRVARSALSLDHQVSTSVSESSFMFIFAEVLIKSASFLCHITSLVLFFSVTLPEYFTVASKHPLTSLATVSEPYKSRKTVTFKRAANP